MGELSEENKFEIIFYIKEGDHNIYYEISYVVSYSNPLYTDEEVLDKYNKYAAKFEMYINEALDKIINEHKLDGTGPSLIKRKIKRGEFKKLEILNILKISSLWDDKVIRDNIHNYILMKKF
jgi:hypothetical protein